MPRSTASAAPTSVEDGAGSFVWALRAYGEDDLDFERERGAALLGLPDA